MDAHYFALFIRHMAYQDIGISLTFMKSKLIKMSTMF